MLSMVLYNKNPNGLLKVLGAWKKKNKSFDVDLTSSVYVSFNRSYVRYCIKQFNSVSFVDLLDIILWLSRFSLMHRVEYMD